MTQKRFNTAFSTNGWVGLYIVTILVGLFIGLLRLPIPYIISDVGTQTILQFATMLFQWLITILLISATASKAVLHFINTLSLDNKQFSTRLNYNAFFTFVLSNILVSVFTLGLYVPWAYKSVACKLAESIEYDGDGRFRFLSLPSKLFIFILVSLVIMLFLSVILALTLYLVIVSENMVLWFLVFVFFLIFVVALSAIVVMMHVFILNWFINIGFSSGKKSCTYTLDIDIVCAVMFYIGQLMLCFLTLGLYTGAYLINMYEYFTNKIVEKQNGEVTGRLMFKRPSDKGAIFLLGQVILSFLSLGFYRPFAYVEYANFFIKNTYLETKDEPEVIILPSEQSAE